MTSISTICLTNDAVAIALGGRYYLCHRWFQSGTREANLICFFLYWLRIDIRQILADNAIREMVAEDDARVLQALRNALPQDADAQSDPGVFRQ